MSEASDRLKLIEEKIRAREETSVMGLSLIREVVREFLLSDKGYAADDIETDRRFEIILDDKTEFTSVDYLISFNQKRFMAIKCTPGALESRERHLIAFARVVGECQIPYALVTDGSRARLLDTAIGKVIAEGLDSIPDRKRAAEMTEAAKFTPCAPERIEKEKRILLAFESISCTQESGE
jgi:hypothetical protein